MLKDSFPMLGQEPRRASIFHNPQFRKTIQVGLNPPDPAPSFTKPLSVSNPPWSQLLPQALISLPRSLQQPQCHFSQNLSFSMEQTPRRFSPIDTVTQFSKLRVSSVRFAALLSGKQRPFVVRAAEETEAESTENTPEEVEAESTSEDEESVAGESEAEVEPRALRKQWVKMGEVMGILNQRAVEASQATTPVPDIRSGDIVEIKWEVPQKRRKFAMYKGIVISKQNAGIHSTIRIRRIISGIGVEIVFPVYAPNIMDIKVLNHRKVRKAKLYYLRDKLPRFCTFNFK